MLYLYNKTLCLFLSSCLLLTLYDSNHAAVSVTPAAHGLGLAPPAHGLLEGDALLLPAVPLVVHLRTAPGCQPCNAVL